METKKCVICETEGQVEAGSSNPYLCCKECEAEYAKILAAAEAASASNAATSDVIAKAIGN